jgi:hypothetical protein
MNALTHLQDAELEQLARKRAGARMGWYIHATVFIAVNLMLATLSAMGGRHWAIFPAFGWGMALAIHGALVFVRTTGLHERLVQRERERLTLQRDPW